jgi:hypothetical protein
MIEVTIAGKTYSGDFLGIKEDDFIRISRNWMNQPRLQKLNKQNGEWENVDHPENYGHPSIQIEHIK